MSKAVVKAPSNYAINPTPEQALRSNRAILPARLIAALGPNMKSVANWMSLLLVLAMAADGYACTPAALRETIAAPDGTEIPLYSTSDYAFIAEIIENTSEPKSAPSVKVRVIESWTGRAKAGENLRVAFVEMVCWDEVAPDAGT